MAHNLKAHRVAAAALVSACLIAGCGGGGAMATSPSSPSPTPSATQVTAADLQHCVDTINSYRSKAGRPALSRSGALEQVATAAAQHDWIAQVPHQYFMQTNDGGVALAENEFFTSPAHYGSVSAAIDFGIQLFWEEGPSGPHYQNIVGPYSQLGCGAFLDGSNMAVATDFR
jgi:hypothetical protein